MGGIQFNGVGVQLRSLTVFVVEIFRYYRQGSICTRSLLKYKIVTRASLQ